MELSEVHVNALTAYQLSGDIDREEVAMTLVDYGHEEEDVEDAIDELFEEGYLEGDDCAGRLTAKGMRASA